MKLKNVRGKFSDFYLKEGFLNSLKDTFKMDSIFLIALKQKHIHLKYLAILLKY